MGMGPAWFRDRQELTKMMEVIVEVCRTLVNRVGEEGRDHAHASVATPWTMVQVEAAGQTYKPVGLAGNWKATALEAKVWVEVVTEGGRRFLAAWRK